MPTPEPQGRDPRHTDDRTRGALVALLYGAAYALLDADRAAPPAWASTWVLAVPLAAHAVSEWRRRDGVRGWRRQFGALASALTAALCLLCVAWLLRALWRPLEAMGIGVGLLAEALVPLLRLLGVHALAEGAFVHADGADDLLSVHVGLDKLALGPVAFGVAAWLAVRDRARRVRLLRVAAALVGVVAVRLAVEFIWLSQIPELFATRGGSRLADVFGNRTLDVAALAALVALCARFGTEGGATPQPEADAAPWRRPAWLAALALVAAWVGFHLEVPGPARTGVVLFDDTHVDTWGRSDRRMDTEWYGDYSTYNFNVALEWVGQYWPAAVVRERAFDAELLRDASVLVLKTPSEPYTDAEVEAIEAWVRAGGGLFAIGDHTDLHGMNTHLNAILSRFGVRLAFDALSDAADASFNVWEPQVGVPVPAFLAGVRSLQFMTPCSIGTAVPPRRALVLERAARDAGDYGRPSHFGARRSDPVSTFGPALGAVALEVDSGRVVVFSDSTVFSSFEFFEKGHDEVFGAAIAWLSREANPTARLLLDAAMATACLALLLLLGRTDWVRAFALAAPALVGVAPALDAWHAHAFARPAPAAGHSRIAFLWIGAQCGMPATLGSTGSLDDEDAFDTLLTDVTRTGGWPFVAREYEASWVDDLRVLVAVNPVWVPPPEFLARVGPFVRGGGTLIVMDRGAATDAVSSADELLAAAGLAPHRPSLDHVDAASGEGPRLVRWSAAGGTEWFHAAIGAGHVYFARPSERYSRAGLGHSFVLPDREQRERLAPFYAAVERAIRHPERRRETYAIIEAVP